MESNKQACKPQRHSKNFPISSSGSSRRGLQSLASAISMDPHWSMARRWFPRVSGTSCTRTNQAVICTFAAFFQAATPLELPPPVATDFPWFCQNLGAALLVPYQSQQNQMWHQCPSVGLFLLDLFNSIAALPIWKTCEKLLKNDRRNSRGTLRQKVLTLATFDIQHSTLALILFKRLRL